MMKRIFILLVVVLLSSTAAAAELTITEAPNAPVETIIFETPSEVPEGWFPLRAVSEYLPIEVYWDSTNREIVVDSEPLKGAWPILAHKSYAMDELAYNDLMILDGVTYCSPRFLYSRLAGVGFMYQNGVWYCDTTIDFDGHVTAAMLELSVKSPDDYALVTKYLTGGVKARTYTHNHVYSYVYPYSSNPVCYINNTRLSGSTLASTIAHEAWHVYQAKNGLAVTEQGASEYEKKISDILLRDVRIYNGTSEIS